MKGNTGGWAALAAASALALAGCGAGNEGGSDAGPRTQSSTETASGAADEATSSEGRSAESSEDEDASDTTKDTDTNPTGTHVARTAGLTITVEDIEQASAKVRSTASSAGGYVSSEETRIDRGETSSGEASRSTASSGDDSSDATPRRAGSWGEIVVTVPVDELDAAMTKLSRIGEVTQRTSDAEDLSAHYTDTESRVRTLQRSVTRLQKLIDSAGDLEEIVALEEQLSEREADLESMVGQKKSLAKRTTTAPITVGLVSPVTAEEEGEENRTGFAAGLESGWGGFTAALGVGLTTLGAITPFAVTGLVLLGPLVWWLRRRTRRPVPDAG